MEEKKYFFENLKNIKDYWVIASLENLEENADLTWTGCENEYQKIQLLLKSEEDKKAYEKVLNEVIQGVLHSVLVMIDGGDDLADQYTVDLVIKGNNQSLKENGALHEDFIDYLMDVEEE